MGLFDKIKDILFDEETVEIPVITKEESEEQDKKKRVNKDDDIIVRKIESLEDETLFDMPKLKKEAEEEVKSTNFTFPVFNDEDDIDIKSTSRVDKYYDVIDTQNEKLKKQEKNKKIDYLSMTEYATTNIEKKGYNKYETSKEKEEKKPFKLSPIISPVYGILNENYKKEDIVSKNDSKSHLSAEKIDLDTVRRKAYGTLENEIEDSLSSDLPTIDVLDEVALKEDITLDDLSDDGLSIRDLLVDKDEEEINTIDLEEQKVKKNEPLGQEDLFDLIDSLYAGKDDN